MHSGKMIMSSMRFSMLLLLTSLSCVTEQIRAEIFHVTPSSNTTCQDRGEICMTISDYASNLDVFDNMTNITIFLLPGNHILDSKLTISNITFLSLSPLIKMNENETLKSFHNVSISCNDSGGLMLENIAEVFIRNLNWFGCTENKVTFVNQFTVEDSFFSGYGHIGTAFILLQVDFSILNRSTFEFFQGSVIFLEEFGFLRLGGVVIALNSTITLSQSTFEHNSAWNGGVMYATSKSMISVQDSIFRYNRAIGDAGGVFAIDNSTLSMSNNNMFYQNTVSFYGGVLFAREGSIVTIKDCAFFGNRADIGGVAFMQTNTNITVRLSTFIDNFANYTGGIIYSHESSLEIYESILSFNIALLGATFSTENSLATIHSCSCVNNSGVLGFVVAVGSTIEVSGDSLFAHNYGSFMLLNSNGQIMGNTIFMYNTHVIGSIASVLHSALDTIGGALSLFRSDTVITDNVQLVHNRAPSSGAILVIQGRLSVNKNVLIAHNKVKGVGGGMLVLSSAIMFTGNVSIANNTAGRTGGGIYAISSTIESLSGTLNFINNSASYGGGMYLELNSKLYIIKEQIEYFTNDASTYVCVSFIGNHAKSFGGAIYFSDNSTSLVCSNTNTYSATSECFLQIIQAHPMLPMNNQFNLRNFFFMNNTANEGGPVLYGGLLDRCSLSALSEVVYNFIPLPSYSGIPYFQAITNIPNITENQVVASDVMRVCFCRESNNNEMIPDCGYVPAPVHVRKGDTFAVWAVAVDQTDLPLNSNILASLSSHESGFKVEGQLVQPTTQSCTELNYNIISPESSLQLLLHADGPCLNLGSSQSSLEVQFLSCDCGIGLQPTDSESVCECVCDSLLEGFAITCENDTLVRGENFWIDYTNVSDSECLVLYSSCPFDYCYDETSSLGRRVNLNIPNGADEQCVLNRTGILCGACQDGLSLSLGNSNCLECSNYWLFLLIPFAILGILLVVFILWCNLTVAVGTINGLIFYANVLTVHRSTLLPSLFNQNPAITHSYFSWLNLDWGFPTCFYNGMDSYAKVWLQLVFPLYLIGIVLSIMVISSHSRRFAKLLSNRDPVATLATLILLSYTKILRVIISALSLAHLECLDGSSRATVWLFDANIPYLEGKHIPLFIMAIVVVVLGIVYTLLLLFGQCIPSMPKWRILSWTRNLKFLLFMETYYAPYNPKHRYWVGLLLLARVLIYLVASYNTTGDLMANLYFVMFVTLCLVLISKVSGRVYKLWVLDVLETSIFMNIIIFSGATLYIIDKGGNQTALAFTSFGIVLLTLVCVFVYHTYTFVFQRTALGKLCVTRACAIHANVFKRFKQNKGEVKLEVKPKPSEMSTFDSSAADLRESILGLSADYHPVEKSTPSPNVMSVQNKPSATVLETFRNDEPPLSAMLLSKTNSEDVGNSSP